ncbi:MAG: 50S ribosomal protein L19 [Elusimicrobia bacterium]|nr:50S ribosomal protein L19 [Elusimicrobiota bacterium]MBU2614017.1 50S ribosomal protein L19 [Elusimicrobiota bacterium]
MINIIPDLQKKKDFPHFSPGDTIRVIVKIHEGDVERLQPFEGIVIRKHSGGYNETFTVRKVSFGIGIERIFSVYAPNIEKIELVKKGVVRRAKLYYLRKLTGKASRIEDEQTSEVQDKSAAVKA